MKLLIVYLIVFFWFNIEELSWTNFLWYFHKLWMINWWIFDSFRPKSNLRARAMLCPVVSTHFYNIRTSEVDPAQVRHDASFDGYRPTVSNRYPEAAAMRYRTINIGKGPTIEVDLDDYGHCNFVSPKHAVIFFDEVSTNNVLFLFFIRLQSFIFFWMGNLVKNK